MKICMILYLVILSFLGCSTDSSVIDSSISITESGPYKKSFSDLVEWGNVITGDNLLMRSQMIVTSDGGCIVFGPTKYTPQSGHYPVYYSGIKVIKFNENGEQEWVQDFDEARYPNNGLSVDQTTDDGYIIGCIGSGHLIKVNHVGFIEWSIDSDMMLGKVIQASDGTYVTYGLLNNGDSRNYVDCYIVKYNTKGEKIWSDIYSFGSDEIIVGLFEPENSRYELIAVDHTYRVASYSENGNLLYNANSDLSYFRYTKSISYTSDGKYLLTMSPRFQGEHAKSIIVKMKVVNEYTSVVAVTDTLVRYLSDTDEFGDSGFITVGSYTGVKAGDGYLAKIKSDGAIDWESESEYELKTIEPINDSTAMILGYKYNSNDDVKVWVGKLTL